MTDKKIAKIMVYLNAYHSWEQSDNGDHPVIKDSLRYCERQINKLAGLDVFDIPSVTLEAIGFLKKID